MWLGLGLALLAYTTEAIEEEEFQDMDFNMEPTLNADDIKK